MSAGLLNRTASFAETIQQGATFLWRRRWGAYPRPIKVSSDRIVYADTGRPVSEDDFVPTDFTGCTARMQVRLTVLVPDVLLEFSTSPSGQGAISLGSDGWVALSLSATQTAALPYGTGAGQWTKAIGQLEVEFADGTVVRLAEVRFTLSPEGTR